MRRVNTADLVPGMVTAEDVYTFNNQLILQKGLVLTDKTITKLELYSIINVRIEDPSGNDSDEDDEFIIPEELYADILPGIDEKSTYSERIKKSPQFIEFKERFEAEIPKFQNLIDSIAKEGDPVDLNAVIGCVDHILQSSEGYVNVFDMLHNMRTYDDLTYVHSLNVSLICNVFARWLHMSEVEVKIATICGLLHDIGKVLVPDSIIKKPDKLTDGEYALVKKHTMEGYNILRKANIAECIANTALMHHERCDGSGYPFGIRNSKIEPFAKLVAIADVYDAMTSARVYRGPMCPFSVIELLENEGLQKYDTRFIMTFLENIVNTHMSQSVRLNNGVVGEIVFINRSSLSRPTIRTEEGFLDLSTRPELFIEEII